MTLADMLVVMNGGRVEQIGVPLAVYEKPATTFVASFIGAPPMNLWRMQAEELSRLGRIVPGTPADGANHRVRPEDLDIAPAPHRPPGAQALALTNQAVERVGPESFIYGTLERGGEVIIRVAGQHAPAPGEKALAVAPPEKLHLFSTDGTRRLE
jgi:sn-glycerol 3-phosphate transport system ATP-binding protein